MVPHVIIIAGAKTRHPSFIDPLLKKYYYDYFGIETGEAGRAWVKPFCEYLHKDPDFLKMFLIGPAALRQHQSCWRLGNWRK